MTASSNGGTRDASGHKVLTKADVVTGAIILVSAQLAAASTASCVHALPAETPSVLRGLWRQTLTSIIFGVLALLFVWRCGATRRHGASSEDAEAEDADTQALLGDGDDNDHESTPAAARLTLIILAVSGQAILNDCIVVALKYASSAAVMCLCNTTPIWLVLFAILNPRSATPGIIIILGATLSLIGAIVCATGDEDGGEAEGDAHLNENLGAFIATIAGVGGAMYMIACRRLHPVGIHPILLTLMCNIGMVIVSFLLCIATLEDGISLTSMDIRSGFWGFLNPAANPAALLHSVFPDCGGNFGIMVALSYFEPLIVSMVMLTEPLNASLIAMNVVGEAPPRRRTIIGVAIVLAGCGIVLWESSKDGKEVEEERKELEMEQAEAVTTAESLRLSVAKKDLINRRMSDYAIVLSPIGFISPDVTAKAAFRRPQDEGAQRSFSLSVSTHRMLAMTEVERQESSRLRLLSESSLPSRRRESLPSNIFRRLSNRIRRWSRPPDYGSIHEVGEEEAQNK